MATTSQNSINSSTSTQNSSADNEINIEDKTKKIGEYFDELLKLRLDRNEIDLKISKKNYKLHNLSHRHSEKRETLNTELDSLRRNKNKIDRQIEKKMKEYFSDNK